MTFNSKCYVHPMFKFVYVLSVPNGHEDEDNVSAQPQTVASTRYPVENEPSYPRIDLTYAKYKLHIENDEEDDDKIPTRLRPLIKLVSPPIPDKTYQEEVLSCALTSSRVFADVVNVQHFYQRPLPLSCRNSESKKQTTSHFALHSWSQNRTFRSFMFTNQEGLWWNGDPLSRVPPMTAVDSAINHTNYLYEGYIYDTKRRPFSLITNWKSKKHLHGESTKRFTKTSIRRFILRSNAQDTT